LLPLLHNGQAAVSLNLIANDLARFEESADIRELLRRVYSGQEKRAELYGSAQRQWNI
jgi:hypothetical protein